MVFRLCTTNLAPELSLPAAPQNTFPWGEAQDKVVLYSPLLFALAIESLAWYITSNPNIRGFIKSNQEYKLSLYADDVLLFLTDPLIFLPNLLTALDTFNHLSGLRVNPSKCIAMPINIPHPLMASLRDRFEFSWNLDSLQYLGICLAPSVRQMYTINYPQDFSNIKRLFTQWSLYRISFLGRIQTIILL